MEGAPAHPFPALASHVGPRVAPLPETPLRKRERRSGVPPGPGPRAGAAQQLLRADFRVVALPSQKRGREDRCRRRFPRLCVAGLPAARYLV